MCVWIHSRGKLGVPFLRSTSVRILDPPVLDFILFTYVRVFPFDLVLSVIISLKPTQEKRTNFNGQRL